MWLSCRRHPRRRIYSHRGDTVDLLRRENAISRTRLLFNQVQPGTLLSRDLDDFAGRIGLEPLKSRIQRRQAYQHAVVSGWKSLPAEARDEIFRVALEVVTGRDIGVVRSQ